MIISLPTSLWVFLGMQDDDDDDDDEGREGEATRRRTKSRSGPQIPEHVQTRSSGHCIVRWTLAALVF